MTRMVTAALLPTGDQILFSTCRLCTRTRRKTPTANDPDLSYRKKSDFSKNNENISQVQGFTCLKLLSTLTISLQGCCTTPGGTTLFDVVDDVSLIEYSVWVLLAVCDRVVLALDFSSWMSCRVAKPLVLLYPSSFLGPTSCIFLPSFF